MKKLSIKLKVLLNKDFFCGLLIFLISLFNLRYFFRPGIFQGHDTENHLARIANYYLTIKDGHIPPRWAKNLNHKFGYPVFNYNYPLANMSAYPLIAAGFNIEDALKIIFFSAYFFSGLFFFLWIRPHISYLPALCGAVFYLAAPYQFLNIYVRGSIGENLCLAMFPAVLFFLDLFLKNKSRLSFSALVFTVLCFSLSHNSLVMIFTPLIFVYYFYQQKKKKLSFFNSGFFSLLLGFFLSSFFWIPAYLEKDFVILEAFDLYTFYLDHFPTLKQLINSVWQFGYSVAGGQDTMSFQIGLIHLAAIVILFAVLLIKKELKGREKNRYFLLLILFLISIFLMLDYSLIIWKIIPFLGYLQFPWRLLALSIFSASLLIAVSAGKFKFLGIGLSLLGLIYCQQFSKPFLWDKKSDIIYYDFLFTTSTRSDNMPRWFLEERNMNFKARLTSDSGLVGFNELLWKTNKHIYEVNVPEETYVWERTAYFPGWEAYIDDIKTEIKYDGYYQGLIGIKVPAGRHQIVTKFTQKTPARLIGNGISILSFLLLAGIVKYYPGFKKRRIRK